LKKYLIVDKYQRIIFPKKRFTFDIYQPDDIDNDFIREMSYETEKDALWFVSRIIVKFGFSKNDLKVISIEV
jgi:hypothetical protein